MIDHDFLRTVGAAALCNPPTLENTWALTESVIRRGVKGDLVECGVFAGSQTAIMAKVCQSFNVDRLVHLFDSFEGIPQAGQFDDASIIDCIGTPSPDKVGALESTGVSVCVLGAVKEHMSRWGINPARLVYHVGWFQYTIPVAYDVVSIAVLRLDGDLYESTKVCLEHLYPKLSRGGYCIIDDYALTGCRRAVDEYLAMLDETPEITSIKGGGGPVYWERR